jgi:NO-binding membrane sensor protein with MHYT domain
VHYIGMAAMRLPAMMEYRWSLVGLSVALAIMISGVALQLAFQVRQAEPNTWRKLISTLVMGSAIPLMHYTGIWAVRFRMADVAFSTQRTV